MVSAGMEVTVALTSFWQELPCSKIDAPKMTWYQVLYIPRSVQDVGRAQLFRKAKYVLNLVRRRNKNHGLKSSNVVSKNRGVL